MIHGLKNKVILKTSSVGNVFNPIRSMQTFLRCGARKYNCNLYIAQTSSVNIAMKLSPANRCPSCKTVANINQSYYPAT